MRWRSAIFPSFSWAPGCPRSKSYAERLFNYPEIGQLDPASARAALVVPANNEGFQFEETAVAEILRVTERYPYFIQEWGFHVWNSAPLSPIGLRDVLHATPCVIAHLDANCFRVTPEEAQRCYDSRRAIILAEGFMSADTELNGAT